jgi:hypothetical protein
MAGSLGNVVPAVLPAPDGWEPGPVGNVVPVVPPALAGREPGKCGSSGSTGAGWPEACLGGRGTYMWVSPLSNSLITHL